MRRFASQAARTLSGRTAVVTGSTSGIGLGVAEHLASLGATVVIHGFGDLQEIQKTCDRLASENDIKVIFNNTADFSQPAQIRDMFFDVEQTLGTNVDILVNNAGKQFISPVASFPDEEWQNIIDLNLSGPFHAIKSVLPGMTENNWGRIVNIASVHGLVSSINKSAYVSAKHGLVGLTKSVALEHAEQNITVNTICPSFVHTPLIQKQIDIIVERDGLDQEAAASKLLGGKVPSLRFIEPRHVGEMVGFLCSDAASNMTGSNMVVDGGWTAQ